MYGPVQIDAAHRLMGVWEKPLKIHNFQKKNTASTPFTLGVFPHTLELGESGT